ncbi:heavy metal response regulator transcription factor [Frigoriglobus tundricola]|uniref:DNA-binding heavy metal response regulator n=1 Tax=Frigoriglobus tundricola TaxID=2774151 RepID=A0A6M5YT06_9BACT|nr:heavy metal response regulator transcription factor [Frigoriglobus tundricola]QJW96453.1 DNA-binding heavy metal response regulator [Frigoriglobus tundricola]
MKVLLIEDEPNTVAYLRQGLAENGYVVDAEGSAELGLRMAARGVYDLVVLDINLPDRSGWWVLKELRGADCRTPVLCLTCCGDVEDRVQGLDLGADDYLTKPFAFSELVARIRSVLRRGAERQPDVIRVADLEVHLTRRQVVRAGGRVRDFRPKEFALLALLARRAGEVLSRTTIVEHVWNADFDFETNAVDVQIKRLREKVDDPFERKLIHTVRGVGYVLEDRG